MDALTVDLANENETAALGARIGRLLKTGDVVCLSGALGAGKTTLARGAIKAVTGEDEAPSPTFALVEPYEGPEMTLYHFDLYRLEAAEDVFELGLEESMEEGACLIEWPEKIEAMLPDHSLLVHLSAQNTHRRALIRTRGDWAARLGRDDAPTENSATGEESRHKKR